MLEFYYAHADFLFALWITGAVTLSFVFGTVAELAESRGQRGPELMASTVVALLWPLVGVGVVAFYVAAGYRKWRSGK